MVLNILREDSFFVHYNIVMFTTYEPHTCNLQCRRHVITHLPCDDTLRSGKSWARFNVFTALHWQSNLIYTNESQRPIVDLNNGTKSCSYPCTLSWHFVNLQIYSTLSINRVMVVININTQGRKSLSNLKSSQAKRGGFTSTVAQQTLLKIPGVVYHLGRPVGRIFAFSPARTRL